MRRLYNFLSNSEKRNLRNRKKLNSGVKRLRISIFKSNRHFYAQLINDEKGVTLTSVSTLDAKIKDVCKRGINTETIKQVSSLMIERLSNMKLEQKLVFDRGAYKYTGLVSQFAEALRSSGFKF
ncbi:50S ribosomal protein L18 [Wolbachia endosymbiont of Brugia malayi]|uniref:Large ribosomal subunit protein uL18 n=1 Tax=Wolbachia sp. subsp. Brugia malayi (strain TRS) TaxID=292805 RepID=RL18_WOLTR|nr:MULTISPECIES: 50S ribosomal protein L18 [unclassified Wolbachia]Q5GSW0.1 RecName: Full=Large ribosomal subunit protein uL18; AltName: Full=50S ribosomal protein L18 [Wolbachia endosymbiont strain TRS of Brugia malayi]AAW70914.1 Ribosomal protein L18 [Wolbachia endosymbiont strain TRS of Brugia malayi]QCB61872.1 50S ribosomal protein L18 [Wolbachia endosymbiont of Brugia malayi]QIT36060.1 ribosomal protein L18 [Wolbachia endosymbiont of Brugia pahangi]